MIRNSLITLGLVFSISGCSSLMNTSFYDANESKAAVDLWVSVKGLDCSLDTRRYQLGSVVDSKEWLKTYSIGKGSKDVQEMVTIIEKTLDGMVEKKEFGESYCNLKKKTLLNQSEKMTKALMGRF